MIAYPAPLTTEIERFSVDSEQWSADGRHAVERRNLEEAIALGLHIFNRLGRHHQEWADRIHAGTEPFTMEQAREFERGYHRWIAAARAILAHARQLEMAGIFVEQASELRFALRHCQYDGVSIDRLVANARLHGPGKGISGSELRNELQARLRAAGGTTAS